MPVRFTQGGPAVSRSGGDQPALGEGPLGLAGAPGAAFSGWQKVRGLLAAAIVGWALVTLIDLGWPQLEWTIAAEFFDREVSWRPSWQQIAGWIRIYAIVGPPIAIGGALLVGFPIWQRAEDRGRTSYADSVRMGALAGAVLAGIGIAVGLVFGLQTALGPGNLEVRWWGYHTIRNGLPTPLGMVFTALDLVSTALVGAVAGVAARAAAGLPHAKGAG